MDLCSDGCVACVCIDKPTYSGVEGPFFQLLQVYRGSRCHLTGVKQAQGGKGSVTWLLPTVPADLRASYQAQG